MKLEHAEMIVGAGESLGLEITRRLDYSGRGMYGKTTAGVEFASQHDLLAALARAGADLAEDDNALADFIDGLGRTNTDSLGRGFIIY